MPVNVSGTVDRIHEINNDEGTPASVMHHEKSGAEGKQDTAEGANEEKSDRKIKTKGGGGRTGKIL